MLDTNYVADTSDDLSSFFEGSVSNEGCVATMPTLTTDPNFNVDDAANDQQDWQDWQDFDGDINDLLSSHPPTYLRQSK